VPAYNGMMLCFACFFSPFYACAFVIEIYRVASSALFALSPNMLDPTVDALLMIFLSDLAILPVQ
jgi:hypothetical protein